MQSVKNPGRSTSMFTIAERIARDIGNQEFKVATELLNQHQERIEIARRKRQIVIEQQKALHKQTIEKINGKLGKVHENDEKNYEKIFSYVTMERKKIQ